MNEDAGSTPDQRVALLSDTLGLAYEPQDWGIVNADGERLDEFVRFLQDSDPAPTDAWQLVELVLASANERLITNPAADLDPALRAVARYPEAAEAQVAYWRSLDDAEEFPIARYLLARVVS